MAFTNDEIDRLRGEVATCFKEITKTTFHISGDKGNKSFDSLLSHMSDILKIPRAQLPGVKPFIGFFHGKKYSFHLNTLIQFNNYAIACKEILKKRAQLENQNSASAKTIQIPKTTYKGAFSVDQNFITNVSRSERRFAIDDFYLAQQMNHCQWYGIVYNDKIGLDVLRNSYQEIKSQILSFDDFRPTIIIIHGDHGCGKSTYLRRLSVDLVNEPVITLWVTNIRFFEETLASIQYDFSNKYVLFIDDWEEQIKDIPDEGKFFLRQMSIQNNLSIIISDGSIKSKPYLLYSREETRFYLSPNENISLLKKLAKKNLSWEKYIDNIILNKEFVINPIYIILFVITHEHAIENFRGKEHINNFLPDFRAIIRHDLNEINFLNFGAALTLYHVARLYKSHRIVFSWKGFASIANNYNKRFFKKIEKLTTFDKSNVLCGMLSKYIYLDELTVSLISKSYAIYFHHTLLADEGLSYGIGAYQKYSKDSIVQLYDNLKCNDLNLSNDLYKLICLEQRGRYWQLDTDPLCYFSFDVKFNELLKTFYEDAEDIIDEDHWKYNLLWIIFYVYERNPKGLPYILETLINKGCHAKCVLKLVELAKSKDFESRPRRVLMDFIMEIFYRASTFGPPPKIFQDYINEFRNKIKLMRLERNFLF